jgi:antitoxin CcdA
LRRLAQKEVAVGFDHSAPRRPVNLNLNSDLVERCKSEVGNLSAHVEELLAADLAKRDAAAEAEKRRTARAIDAFSALYETHGSLSEEMQSL